MVLPPSRKDTFGPPKAGRNLSDLSALVRHHGTYLRNLDPGIQDGRWNSLKPVPPGPAIDLVGDDGGDGAAGGADIAFWNTDQAVAGEPGQITLTLTYEPIDGSLHIRWNGIDQPPTEWTLDGQTVTFTSDLIRYGDLLTSAYAYDNGEIPDPSSDVVTYEASNWYWLQVPSAPNVDYSDPVYGDPAPWALASAPFGKTTPDHTVGETFVGVGWPDYLTEWAQTTRMWAWRTIVVEPDIPVTIYMRFNRAIAVYWNGNLRYTNSGAAAEKSVTIDGSEVLTSNLLMFKIVDDAFTGPHTGCYFDAHVTQVVE
jgi:hypothetical protein